jgi:hypothetical protein
MVGEHVKPGIIDKNGIEVEAGQYIEIRVKTWDGSIPICKGVIEYRSEDISSLGCGFGVADPERGRFTFLSSISKSRTEIEVVDR